MICILLESKFSVKPSVFVVVFRCAHVDNLFAGLVFNIVMYKECVLCLSFNILRLYYDIIVLILTSHPLN